MPLIGVTRQALRVTSSARASHRPTGVSLITSGRRGGLRLAASGGASGCRVKALGAKGRLRGVSSCARLSPVRGLRRTSARSGTATAITLRFAVTSRGRGGSRGGRA